MRELFVYYRAADVDAAIVEATARGFQAELATRFPQLVARLLYRHDAALRRHTWMETYRTDPTLDAAGVSPAIQAAIEERAGALQPYLVGTRHTEAFEACAS